MIEPIDRISGFTTKQAVSNEVSLAQKLQPPLDRLIDALKNLSPMGTESDATLSSLSQTIVQLHETAKQAATLD